MKHNILLASMAAACLAITTPAFAADAKIEMMQITADGAGSSVGTITAADSDKGLNLSVDLKGLKPGPHGFHLHEKPSCDAAEKDGKMTAGLAAGGHFDPAGTKHHMGPEGTGHKGDLPLLQVSDDGSAKAKLVASHLKLDDLKGHALMIHEGGDNYTDEPANGGGGARIACGVVP
jgi:superoxide dismutase, Cu-Zn family